MGGDEIVEEVPNVSPDKVEAVICRCLGLSEPKPEKKGITGLLLGK
jgi:CDGSH-type Zn-finger protein